MRRPTTVLAASLVSVSCATAGSRGGGGAPVSARRDAPALRVADATLGTLQVTKWRLANGLEVILAPDPAARSVAYVTYFRVGSRHEDEPAGETGLAHLFEHLMFTQVKGDAAPGEFDRRMESIGANVNAMTYYDYTAYVDVLPPTGIPVAAELESARMHELVLGPEQVATEREVVAEERLSTTEDDVDGLLEEVLHKAAFRHHPYRWPIIGWMKDIRAVTPEKALRFYRTFYAPNNAVLVLVGKFETAAAMAIIQQRYGGLAPSDQLPRDVIQPERAPSTASRASLTRPVPADRLLMGFPSPGLGAADRAAFELVDEVLTGGPSARLYRALVVNGELASSVSASPAPTKDPGLWSLVVQMQHGHTAAEAEAIIDRELGRMVAETISESDLRAAQNRVETAFWASLTSSEGKAEALGHYDVSTGDFRNLLQRGSQFQAVTAQDVREAAARYLSGPRAVVVATPSGAVESAPPSAGEPLQP